MREIEPGAREDTELALLFDAILRLYHYDFRSYAQASLRRAVARARAALGCETTTQLLDRIVHQPAVFVALLRYLTINTSELFRDPEYFRAMREDVLPHLATYPSIRLWVAGCGAGEEAYSFAILLHEENLLERSLIYATDIDLECLRSAAAGVYSLRRMRDFTENYYAAGGRRSLSDHYTSGYTNAVFAPLLRRRILFSDHSLATDAGFAEVQLISCRNVLIYFQQPLQDRAIAMFVDSLSPRGFLGLGSQETLSFCTHAASFEPFLRDLAIYRRR